MIFRVKDNKLHLVDIEVQNEEKFVLENSTANVLYITVNKDELPVIEGRENLIYFYELDEDGNIAVDIERTLQRYKEDLIFVINKRRDDMLLAGFDWAQPSSEVKAHFILNQEYKDTFMALALSVLLGQTEDLFIIDSNDKTIVLSAEDVKKLALLVSQKVSAIYYQARQLKDSILACQDFDCIDQILADL